MDELYPFVMEGARAMVFVDGENLAIRYGAMAKTAGGPSEAREKIVAGRYQPDIGVWAQMLSPPANSLPGTRVIRKYYYTSVQGDDAKLNSVADWLKSIGFESPRVFKKDKTKGSKRVDISLTTDMLSHAFRHHYSIAALIAGDEDYVPLVRAVKAEGARVHVWFLSDGLSPRLRHEADYFVNLDEYFGL